MNEIFETVTSNNPYSIKNNQGHQVKLANGESFDAVLFKLWEGKHPFKIAKELNLSWKTVRTFRKIMRNSPMHNYLLEATKK